MQKTIETKYNIYKIGFKRIPKETYIQRQERIEKSKQIFIQKVISLFFMVVSFIGSFIIKDGTAIIFSLIIGIPLILTDKVHINL